MTVASVVDITWEDLEDLTITKLGHQKKILKAIKRITDILAGRRGTAVMPVQEINTEKKKYQEVLITPRQSQPITCCPIKI